MKYLAAFLIVFILGIALSACSPVPTGAPPAADTLAVPSSAEAYPPPQQSSQSEESYPGPDPVEQASAFPDSVEIPQPGPDLGVVTGRILQAGTTEAYLAPTLVLGELVFPDNPEAPPLVGYSVETDPIGVEDRTGRFVFADVKPGKYAIVIWTPLTQTLVMDSQGSTVQVEVEAGKIVDLGDVYVP